MYGVEFYNTENCKYGREIANKGLAGLGYTDHVWVTGVIVDIVDVIHRLTVECTLFYGVLLCFIATRLKYAIGKT